MAEINLSDYVLESKTELGELADVIREKSKVTGELSVADMKVAVEGISGGDDSVLKSLIDRSITEIEIPSGITSIGSFAFRGCSTLKRVKIPKGVTKINANAFNECKALESVDFPDGVQYINSYAFSLCNVLKKVKLPYGLKSMAFAAFQNTKLEEVELPNTLEKIEQYVFYGTNLTSITLPNSITSMNNQVFTETKTLTTIYCDWGPGEKPTVEANAPWGATNADIVYLGSTKGVTFALNDDGLGYTVTGFDMDLWYEIYGYEGQIDLVIGPRHNGLPVTAIKKYAFDRSGFGSPITARSVSLPDTLKSIGAYAFGDQSLESLTIPDSVIEIGNGAFAYNWALTTVTLGAGCKNMPTDVFMGCSSLANIIAPWSDNILTNAPWGAENAEVIYDMTYGTYGLLYEYDEALGGYAVTGYQYDEDLSSTAVVIPSIHNGKKVVAIADSAFMQQGGGTTAMITSIVIPEGVTSIGYAAFEYQYVLSSVSLPSTLKSIGAYAFESCNMLTSIDIPESVESIGEYAFGSSGLTSITLSRADPLDLGENAFTYCMNMTSAYLNYGVGRITHSVFSSSLMSVNSRVYVAWGEDSDIYKADDYLGFTANAEIYYDYNFD